MMPSIVARLVTRSHDPLLNVVNPRDFIIRCYKVLKSSALWIVQLPKAVATTISHWISSISRTISDVGQVIKATIQAILKGIAIGIITVLSLLLLYIAVLALMKVYRIYQRQKELQTRHELHAQRQKEEAERRARIMEDMRKRQATIEERRQGELKRQEALEAQRHADNDQRVYKQWVGQCEVLLSCRETMTRFPDPPFWPYSSKCQHDGALQACSHTIKRLYQVSGAHLEGLLKKERLKWHPDTFERCPDSSREHLKAKAKEMYQIIESLRAGG